MTSKEEFDSNIAFRRWKQRMGFTYRQAASSLGICISTAGFYKAGVRRENKNDDSKPVEVPKAILLACAAIENNLPPIQ